MKYGFISKKSCTQAEESISFCIKRIIRLAIVIFFIYLFFAIPLLFADYDYWDDGVRFMDGSYGWMWQGRFLTEGLMRVLVPGGMVDVSPLIQILALFALAISTAIIIFVFTDGKMSILSIVLGLSFGFNPWFLECLSYKNDSFIMALSVLSAIIPFLFANNRKLFVFSSIIGLTCLCNLYQSSTGLYIILVVFYCCKLWLRDERQFKDVVLFALVAAFVFVIVVGLFSFIVVAFGMSWRNVDPIAAKDGYFVFIQNIKSIAMTLWNSFSVFSKVLMVFSFIIGIVFSTFSSKQNKVLSFFILLCATAISLFLSQGQYIFLEEPVLFPRTVYCAGFVFPVLLILSTNGLSGKYTKLIYIVPIYFIWTLALCTLTYGNALKQQKEYDSKLITSISSVLAEYDGEATSVSFDGSTAFAPEVEISRRIYPIFNSLVRSNLSPDYDWNRFQHIVDRNCLDFDLVEKEFDYTGAKIIIDLPRFEIYENGNVLN